MAVTGRSEPHAITCEIRFYVNAARMAVANPELHRVQARYIALQAQNGKPVMKSATSEQVGLARTNLQPLGTDTGSVPVEPGPVALSGSTTIKTVQTGKRRRR
jgi:hypothetical protein